MLERFAFAAVSFKLSVEVRFDEVWLPAPNRTEDETSFASSTDYIDDYGALILSL